MEKAIVARILDFHGNNQILDQILIFTAVYSSYIFVGFFLLALVLILVDRDKNRFGSLLSAVLVLSLVLVANSLVRGLVGRERPFIVLAEYCSLIYHTANNSFPSNHAAASFAVAWVCFLAKPLYGWSVFPLAGLVSFSRVYVGVHFPTDVLAGVLVAGGVMVLVIRCQPWLDRLGERLERGLRRIRE